MCPLFEMQRSTCQKRNARFEKRNHEPDVYVLGGREQNDVAGVSAEGHDYDCMDIMSPALRLKNVARVVAREGDELKCQASREWCICVAS